MDDTIVINIELGDNVSPPENFNNFIIKVPQNISWADFELLLKLSYEEDLLDVNYYDDEDDLIRLSSDEELILAFQYAIHENNKTLRLKLVSGVPKLNILPVEDDEICESPKVEESFSKLKPEVMMFNISPESNINVLRSPPEDAIILSCGSETDCSDISSCASLTSDEHKTLRRYFTLKNKGTGLTLGLEKTNHLFTDKLNFYLIENEQFYDPDQLFYEDAQTCTIRNFRDELCLDLYNKFSTVQSYNPDRMSQSWIIQGDRICQQYNTNWAIGIFPGNIIVASHLLNDSTFLWTVKYVNKKYFTVQSNSCNLFLTVNRNEGPPYKLSLRESEARNYNLDCALKNALLFYSDDDNRIASSWNDMVIEIIDNDSSIHSVKLSRKSNDAKYQQWTIQDENIRSVLKPELSLSCSFMKFPSLYALIQSESLLQKWDCSFINSKDDITFVESCCNSKEIKGSINSASMDSQTIDFISNRAERLSNMSRRPQLLTSSSSETTSELIQYEDTEPPAWFHVYMTQFRKVLTEEVILVMDKAKMSTSSDSTLIGDLIKENPLEDISNVHIGIFCNNCDVTIIGVRYKCANCVDFDLCMQCEAKDSVHDPMHVYLKIKKPVESSFFLNKKGKSASILKDVLYKPKSLKSKDDKEDKKQEVRFKKSEIKKELPRVKRASSKESSKKEKKDKPKKIVRLNAKLLRDGTIPDGTHLPKGTRFIKRWIMQNNGTDTWSSKTKLTLLWSTIPCSTSEVPVPHAKPGCNSAILEVEMTAPNVSGYYQSYWSLIHCGNRFGPKIWCSIVVDDLETIEPFLSPKSSILDITTISNDMEGVTLQENKSTDFNMDRILSPSDIVTSGSYFLRERKTTRASQITTPNNSTSEDSPALTPNREDVNRNRGVSTSSSVEVVSDPSPGEIVNIINEVSDVKYSFLGMNSDAQNETTMISSMSENSDSDSDFYVVPLPDCFDPDLPISPCASNTIKVTKDGKIVEKSERKVSVDDLLWASCTLNVPTLEANPVEHDSADSSNLIKDSGLESGDEDDMFKEAESDMPHKTEEPSTPQCDQDEFYLASGVNEYSETTENKFNIDVEKAIATQPSGLNQIFSLDRKSNSLLSSSSLTESKLFDAMKDESSKSSSSSSGLDLQLSEDVISKKKFSGMSYSYPIQDPAVSGSNDSTYYEEDTKDSECLGATGVTPEEKCRTRNPQSPKLLSPANDVVGQMISTAFDVATKTAAVVYQTSKDVFNTLQANDKYIPTTSIWTPTKSSWTPSTQKIPVSSRWSPSREHWVPSDDKWLPSEEKWVPNEENWTPSNEKWTPSNEKWMPSNEKWLPSEENVELFRKDSFTHETNSTQSLKIDETRDESSVDTSIIQPDEDDLQKLIDMGFLDWDKNRFVLKKYDNDIEKAIQDLLEFD